MKKSIIVLRAITVLFLVVCIILTYRLSTGLISNLQIYSKIKLIPFSFWLFVILVCVNLLLEDTGFIKIGAIIIIFVGCFTLIYELVNTSTSYDLVTTDEYELLLETVEAQSSETYNVYKKDSIFYSRYVGSITVANYYNKSYEIVDDTFLVTKCTDVSCITAELDLE